MWIWRRMERVKWTDRIRNEAETDQEEEKELIGSLAEKKLPTEGCIGSNGERKKSSGKPHRKKSSGVMSGDRGGHGVGPSPTVKECVIEESAHG
ncbi:hypothetical protein ANN_00607 [Periplaneta americana]|uniref:Uncharacterized protein n=1 Tax=Periplaneta americana TaxID=6978 RepID=A0ABQ8TU60_PERAM|nr:hypothetical protein ANN_00607 [Periplaneta americana]